jgi:histidinol-phosphatase
MLSRERDCALEALRAGADVAMSHFGKLPSVEYKADNSPVTIADRQAEAAIVRVLRDAFPDDGILGEEGGEHSGTSGRRWIIDPIDGTRAYARNASHWGPLVALEDAGSVVLGCAALPVLGEVYVATRGGGAKRDDEPIAVSSVREIEQSIASLGSLPRLLSAEVGDGVIAITKSCAYVYAGNDLAGGLMMARGEADIWIESGVQLWDIAPLKVIIEEAGGVFTDFQGNDDLSGGRVLAAATPELHVALLPLLNV